MLGKQSRLHHALLACMTAYLLGEIRIVGTTAWKDGQQELTLCAHIVYLVQCTTSLKAELVRLCNIRVQAEDEGMLTRKAYCMLTVLLQPGRIAMVLIAASWASACWVWRSRRAIVDAVTTAYNTASTVMTTRGSFLRGFSCCKLSRPAQDGDAQGRVQCKKLAAATVSIITATSRVPDVASVLSTSRQID